MTTGAIVRAVTIGCLASALAACSIGETNPLYFGTTTSDESSNGQPYPNRSTRISDVAGEDFRVRLARFVTDADGQTRLLVSEEMVLMQELGTSDEPEILTLTMDGETLVFDPNTDLAELNGQTYRQYTIRF